MLVSLLLVVELVALDLVFDHEGNRLLERLRTRLGILQLLNPFLRPLLEPLHERERKRLIVLPFLDCLRDNSVLLIRCNS